MKNSALFPLCALLVFLFVALPGHAKAPPTAPAQPGYWNIETNLVTRDCTIVRFYNAQHQLVYEEKLPGARSFGEPSSGYCNSKAGFVFGHQEGYLLLTTHYVANRHRRVNTSGQVQPDVRVNSSRDDFEHLTADPAVQAATQGPATLKFR